MICQLKCCKKCQGDLVLDGEEWRCWQCGQYYYPPLREGEALEEPPNSVALSTESVPPRRKLRRSLRDINSAIAARDRSERRWWIRNLDIIRRLDEGNSVKDVATAVGRGPRQVRVVREKLYDLRSSGATELPVS